MAQHPIKTTSGAPDRGLLSLTDYVDPFGNAWVTGAVTISGSVLVTPSGSFPVTLSGIGAINISQLGGQAFSLGQKASIASLPVVIASDQSPVVVALPSVSLGNSPLSSTSTAYETNRPVKASPGVCFGIAGYNSKAATQFILVLDASILPANGAIPVDVVSVAASSSFSIDYGYWGRRFNAGILVANSSTGPTLTLGSADCWYDVRYL